MKTSSGKEKQHYVQRANRYLKFFPLSNLINELFNYTKGYQLGKGIGIK